MRMEANSWVTRRPPQCCAHATDVSQHRHGPLLAGILAPRTQRLLSEVVLGREPKHAARRRTNPASSCARRSMASNEEETTMKTDPTNAAAGGRREFSRTAASAGGLALVG